MSDLVERLEREAQECAAVHDVSMCELLREAAAALRAEREARIAAEQRAERLAGLLMEARDVIANPPEGPHDDVMAALDLIERIDAEAS